MGKQSPVSRRRPRPWIRIIWIRAIPKPPIVQLRIKPKGGKASTIRVAYRATKRTLRRRKR
jgi:hypothetical protein